MRARLPLTLVMLSMLLTAGSALLLTGTRVELVLSAWALPLLPLTPCCCCWLLLCLSNRGP